MIKLLLFVFSLISVGIHAQTQISTVSQFQNMSLTGNYILMNDLDLSSITLDPIGGKSGTFNGTFDGNGYTINIGSVNYTYKYRGLFSRIGSSGTVKNLKVTANSGLDTQVEGTCYMGGVAGRNDGTITNCSTSFPISSSDGATIYMGGIAGINTGTITYCFANGGISGPKDNGGTGGIAGNIYVLVSGNIPVISNCIYAGKVTKWNKTTSTKYGMICGYAECSPTNITDCYYVDSNNLTGIGYSMDAVADAGHCTALSQFDIRALAKTGGIYASTTNDVFKAAILSFPYKDITFNESDGLSTLSNIAGEPANVRFYRGFTKNVKCTVCFPFGIPIADATRYGKFYTFQGIKDGTTDVAQMQEMTTDLEANTAYVFEPKYTYSASTGIAFDNVTIASTLTPVVPTSDFQFIGTYSPITWEAGNTDLGHVYGFAVSGYESEGFTAGQFVKVGAGASASPFRAYLKYNGNLTDVAASRRIGELQLPDVLNIEWISANGNTSGVNTMGSIQPDDIWFTIDGRKTNGKPTKAGIYVNKGKKIIIK